MQIIRNTIYRTAKSKPVQRLIKSISKPDKEPLLNVAIPIIEATYAKAFYCMTVKNNKNIPEERKNPMIIQSAISGVAGIFGGAALASAVNPFKNKVVENIEKSSLKNKLGIKNGLNILVPLLATTFAMRYVIPVISVPISVSLNSMFKKKKSNKITQQEKYNMFKKGLDYKC
jgi:hypothetical protein